MNNFLYNLGSYFSFDNQFLGTNWGNYFIMEPISMGPYFQHSRKLSKSDGCEKIIIIPILHLMIPYSNTLKPFKYFRELTRDSRSRLSLRRITKTLPLVGPAKMPCVRPASVPIRVLSSVITMMANMLPHIAMAVVFVDLVVVVAVGICCSVDQSKASKAGKQIYVPC